MESNFKKFIRKHRIPQELKYIISGQKNHGITCEPINDDLTKLLAIIPGPPGTPYEDGKFQVRIQLHDEYPFQPPSIQFITRIFHPNIDRVGNICLDVLRKPPLGAYRSCQTLESILLSIQVLLATPNPDDPLQTEIGALYKTNLAKFNSKAKEYVKLYCVSNAKEEKQKECEKEKKKEEEEEKEKLKKELEVQEKLKKEVEEQEKLKKELDEQEKLKKEKIKQEKKEVDAQKEQKMKVEVETQMEQNKEQQEVVNAAVTVKKIVPSLRKSKKTEPLQKLTTAEVNELENKTPNAVKQQRKIDENVEEQQKMHTTKKPKLN